MLYGRSLLREKQLFSIGTEAEGVSITRCLDQSSSKKKAFLNAIIAFDKKFYKEQLLELFAKVRLTNDSLVEYELEEAKDRDTRNYFGRSNSRMKFRMKGETM